MSSTVVEKTDEQICSVEIELYNSLYQKKDEIVKSAATKLELSNNYEGELYKISSVITKLFPAFSSSTISIALEDKYKRAYTKPDEDDDDTPLTQFEEFLFILEDNINSLNKSIKSILRRARKDPELRNELEKTFETSIHSFHENLDTFMQDLRTELFEIEDIAGLINYNKKLGIDIKVLEQETDWRILLDAAIKFGLKQQFATHHFKELGKKMKISGKWLSKLEHDENFAAFQDKLSKCPKCDFDYTDYINRQKLAQETGIEIDAIKPLTLSCNDCNSKNINKE